MHLLSLCSLKIFLSQMTPYANKQKKLAKEISTAYLIPPLLRMFQWAQTQRQCRPHWRKSHLLLVSYPVYNTREVVGSRVFFSLNSRFFSAVPRLKMKNGLFDDLVAAKTYWKHRYSTSNYYCSRLKASASLSSIYILLTMVVFMIRTLDHSKNFVTIELSCLCLDWYIYRQVSCNIYFVGAFWKIAFIQFCLSDFWQPV